MIVLLVLILALAGGWSYSARIRQVAETAPPIAAATTDPGGTLSVIIPAYNEADNIRDCLISVLTCSDWPAERLEVWVVDDQSSDDTLAIMRSLQQELGDPRLQIITAPTRPQQQTWVGKNWACAQATQQTKRDFLLFLDADVRLKPGAIATAVQAMQQEQIDLLTLAPAIVCGCWSEWLVQPLMASLLMAGFDFNEVNDPHSEAAFAGGMFMLFRHTAYEQLGGHSAVADQVVEDVELARRVKLNGLKLKYALGADLASVRMYRSWSAVWEGWTKNWHLGSRRNWVISLYSAAIMIVVYGLPWLGVVGLLLKGLIAEIDQFEVLAVGVAMAAIGLQYRLRQSINRVTAIPLQYWWLSGVGGFLVAAIVVASLIKTETGWGWTWRGRSLKLPDQPVAQTR